jgi:hypothetical protein
MAIEYNEFGNLKYGTYEMSIDEFRITFCYNEHRLWLFEGMQLAIEHLKKIGCEAIYVDGSFVTKKIMPSDYDLCWDDTGINLVNVSRACPSLTDAGRKMEKIKKVYRGDVAPANNIADLKKGINFLGYFMEDKQGRAKGIIRISLI